MPPPVAAAGFPLGVHGAALIWSLLELLPGVPGGPPKGAEAGDLVISGVLEVTVNEDIGWCVYCSIIWFSLRATLFFFSTISPLQ